MTQAPTIRCDCGARVPVQPTSAYEFEWRCPCGLAGVVSWFHGAPPPLLSAKSVFNGEQQGELFP